MKDNTSNQEQLNKIIEFRQGMYDCLGKAKDAQFQLVDALLGDLRPDSFAELSLSPQFERGWGSAYEAIENGTIATEKLNQLFVEQLPLDETVICPLDSTVWPHPKARTLEGLVYENSPTKAACKQTAVVGHIYSWLGWVPVRGKSWGLGLSTERMTLDSDVLALGVSQVQQVAAQRQEQGATGLLVVPVDGKYGTHHFLAPLRKIPQLAVVARLRRDRVLYGPPPPYTGHGRPAKHGDRFAFKEETTWHEPNEEVRFYDERWGEVRLRGWRNLHAKQDADTPFTAIYVEVRLEREKRPRPIWLAYLGPETTAIQQAWLWFDHRWPIEPAIRFRKQKLAWTLPKLLTVERCDHWSWLVESAFWQLYLTRPLIEDNPLPWQLPQRKLTPTRTLRGFARLFALIGTPTQPCQSRQNGKGWPTGKPRTRPQRFKPVRRSKKRSKKRSKSA